MFVVLLFDLLAMLGVDGRGQGVENFVRRGVVDGVQDGL